MYLNRVTLIGYLARDPEFRGTPDDPAAVLTLVTKRSWKDANGAWQSRSDFHRCVAWGTALNGVAKTLTKGSHVQIEGELHSRNRPDTDHPHVEVRIASLAVISRAAIRHEITPVESDPSPAS